MKRIGYIGLSTPSFYDYSQQASRAPSDSSSSPNPVIEGAFGALLLYDELWFLCRSLCPENMRHLPYIKFLDECGNVPSIDPDWLPDPEDVFHPEALSVFLRSSAQYQLVKDQAKVYWNAAADNHTHALIIGDVKLNGNSWSAKNVLFDLAIVERLPKRVELVTNSFTSSLFKTEATAGARLQLTEGLVLEGVPQFLTPLGPYHPCIEEVRKSTFLSNFRSWISNDAFASSKKEIKEIKQEAELRLAEAQERIFLKYLNPAGGYKSFAETILGFGMDTIVPGSGAVKDLVEQKKEEKKKQGMRWQGFILDTKKIIRSGIDSGR